MEVSDEVVFNIFKDLSKKQVNPIELAKLIKDYREKNSLTQKELAEQIGIPRNTLNNWESFDRITQEQWKELEDLGFSKTEITNAVRNNKVDKLIKNTKPVDIDILLEQFITKLKPFVREKPEISNGTSLLLYNLKNTIMKIESNIKG